jgi:hypothetical protein
VLIDVNVDGQYAHLIRANSRFWNVSGVKADIGLTGGTIEVETVQSLLAGGIAFNTPEREMGATVKAGHRYPLHAKAEKEWLEWSPASCPELFPCSSKTGLVPVFLWPHGLSHQEGRRTVVRCRPSFWVSEIAPCTTTPTSPITSCVTLRSSCHPISPWRHSWQLPAAAAAQHPGQYPQDHGIRVCRPHGAAWLATGSRALV